MEESEEEEEEEDIPSKVRRRQERSGGLKGSNCESWQQCASTFEGLDMVAFTRIPYPAKKGHLAQPGSVQGAHYNVFGLT